MRPEACNHPGCTGTVAGPNWRVGRCGGVLFGTVDDPGRGCGRFFCDDHLVVSGDGPFYCRECWGRGGSRTAYVIMGTSDAEDGVARTWVVGWTFSRSDAEAELGRIRSGVEEVRREMVAVSEKFLAENPVPPRPPYGSPDPIGERERFMIKADHLSRRRRAIHEAAVDMFRFDPNVDADDVFLNAVSYRLHECDGIRTAGEENPRET